MIRPADARSAGLLVLTLAALAGCSREAPVEAAVGRHHVRLVVPAGWEHLDHGREHVFRRDETRIFLADLGPIAKEGIQAELHSAREVWLAGGRRDAFARVLRLRAAALAEATPEQRAAFWRAWYDATWPGESADSAAIGAGFDALMEAAATLPAVSRTAMASYAFEVSPDSKRSEIAKETDRTIRGATWRVAEAHDRVTHLAPARLACVDDGGYLLVLRTGRGSFDLAAPAFESLLASIELTTGGRPSP